MLMHFLGTKLLIVLLIHPNSCWWCILKPNMLSGVNIIHVDFFIYIYIYGVTVPQPTVERVSQPAVTWSNICHISVVECGCQKNQKHPA